MIAKFISNKEPNNIIEFAPDYANSGLMVEIAEFQGEELLVQIDFIQLQELIIYLNSLKDKLIKLSNE